MICRSNYRVADLTDLVFPDWTLASTCLTFDDIHHNGPASYVLYLTLDNNLTISSFVYLNPDRSRFDNAILTKVGTYLIDVSKLNCNSDIYTHMSELIHNIILWISQSR